MKPYRDIPTVAQFLKDTGRTKHDVLKFLNLADDAMMRSIDNLLEKWELHRNGTFPLSQPKVLYVLTQLYFGTQNWLNHPSRSPRRKTQQPVVKSLWTVVVEKLCWAFDCNANQLLEHINNLYGKVEIQPDKQAADLANPTVYFNSAVLNAFRLTFKNGLIYMWDWYHTGKGELARKHLSEMKLVKANSVKAWRQGTMTPGFGGYVVSVL